MRHLKAGRKIGRNSSHRTALFRNMTTALIHHERIETTGAKAKELRRYVEKIITLARAGDVHSRRQVLKFISDKQAVNKLFTKLTDRYRERNGGYTRILRLGNRNGDNAPMALVELVDTDVPIDFGKKKKSEVAESKIGEIKEKIKSKVKG